MTRWITEARRDGVHVDGDSVEVGGWLVTACAWWEGPETLASPAGLPRRGRRRAGRAPWLWVYHGPPEGPLAWTGSKYYGDPELPALLDRHQPEVVLCGHIHQAPFVAAARGATGAGPRCCSTAGTSAGNIPAHVFLDLDEAHRVVVVDGGGRTRCPSPASAAATAQ